MRTLCIYAFHQYNYNVAFFIKNGLFKDPNVDFYFVINDPNLKLEVPGCTVVNRENINLDNGAWSHVLFTIKEDSKYIYEEYDYFMFLNSTVRGPFLPVWQKDKNWVRMFTDGITDNLKLFGTMICFFDSKVHVQSMCFATDKIGLQVGINAGIFVPNEPLLEKFTICMQKEIGYSTAILDAGYNIGCMLKAYHGIDFRTIDRNGIGTLCFFDPYSYFGTNVHPYEVIFCKIMGDDRQSGHNKLLIDKYTNWQTQPEEIRNESFDWVYYLLRHEDLRRANIKTKNGALLHYQYHGQFEKRWINSHSGCPDYYKIDLNPLQTSGLLNQLWSLVNGILIGHYVGRHIVVTSFYPDYDQARTIPIAEIIDIPALNCLIAKLGLNTHVATNITDSNWEPSKFINPTKTVFPSCGFIGTLAILKSEHNKYIDICDTFCDSMFKQNIDPHIQNLFIKLISGIKFTKSVNDIIDFISLSPGYKAVHLRLEDDIIKHRPYKSMSEQEFGDSVYQKYKDIFKYFATPEDTMFISSHLIKSQNMYNYVIDELKISYPKMVMTNNWREIFPNFYIGRDIDALIDYLLCLNGSLFIGYAFSTFSQAIKYTYDSQNKPVVIIS